jgi:hypothetical protein
MRYVPESRSCSMGPRSMLLPMCRSLWGPVRCPCSSAATHLSSGMSMIRRNDSKPAAGLPPALILGPSAGSSGAAVLAGSGTPASPASPSSQRPMPGSRLVTICGARAEYAEVREQRRGVGQGESGVPE